MHYPRIKVGWLPLLAALLAALACNSPSAAAPESPAASTVEAGSPVPATGDAGQATAVSTPTTAPTPEPAVLRVAFNNDGNVWLWTEGGQAAPLTTSGGVIDLDLSDDGAVIAFVRAPDFQNFELWAIDSDGTNERLLVGAEEIRALDTSADISGVAIYQVAWVGRSHTLAYNTYAYFMGPGALFHQNLRLVNADTLEKTILLEAGQSGEAFTYSPDGSQIALVTSSAISLIDADGSNRRDNLVTYREIGLGEALYRPDPVWASDSTRLRVAIPSTGPYDPEPGPTAIWEIPAVSGSPAQIGSILDPHMSVALSPDLNRIAFVVPYGEPADNLRELHIANADGSNDVIYYSGPNISFYGWTPDSQRFVFQVDQAMAQIGQVGANPTQLTDVPIQWLHVPVWIDANRFVAVSPEGETWYLRMGTVGGASTVITPITGNMQGLPVVDFAD